jgi:DNA-binding transcriptional MerR regulator
LDKSPDAFRTISEVADDLDMPQHVLRFWETRFSQIKPLKRGGGRRYYRPDDVDLLKGLRRLLYGEGYTIKGVQRILKEQGARHVVAIGRGGPLPSASAEGRDSGLEVSTPDIPAPDMPPVDPMPAIREPTDVRMAPPPRGQAPLQSAPEEAATGMGRRSAVSPVGLNRLKAALFELGEARERLFAVAAPQGSVTEDAQ